MEQISLKKKEDQKIHVVLDLLKKTGKHKRVKRDVKIQI